MKNMIGWIVSLIGVGAVTFFIFYLNRTYKYHRSISQDLDAELLSPTDFTVKFNIPKEAWTKFLEVYDETETDRKPSNLSMFRDVIID